MRINKSLIAGILALMIIGGLPSCKGRTTKDVVPTGDTVEVVINTPDIQTDSTASNPE